MGAHWNLKVGLNYSAVDCNWFWCRTLEVECSIGELKLLLGFFRSVGFFPHIGVR